MNFHESRNSQHDPDFRQADQIFLAVDCIIFGFKDGTLNLLIVNRDEPPHIGEPSLIGGNVPADESLDSAALRVLKKYTGLTDVYLEQFHAFGSVERDGDDRTVAVGYYALVDQEVASRHLTSQHGACWISLPELPPLVFDHDKMVERAMRRLRYRAIHEPVAFGLLPEKFTLTQLQTLYEAIFDTPIDAGNFRRRLRKMDYLIRLAEKDLSTSRKGAWYYSFSQTEFDREVEKGHQFLLKP